ncbi:MAG: hypothetical protein KGD57_02430, partial [Candidatus Lokiarchaeota archaeon]|nr:hypothetical protein [Candidatus Lokiarchaeota archaeon]
MKKHKRSIIIALTLIFLMILPLGGNIFVPQGQLRTAAAGDVWLTDVPQLEVGNTYDMQVLIDCGSQDVAAYGFDINWDPSVVIVLGDADGVVAGADGFIAAKNIDNTAGTMRISGFSASGEPGSSEFHMLTITWEAVGAGETLLDLIVNTLIDADLVNIGTPNAIDTTIVVGGPAVAPVINSPSNVNYQEGQTGNSITWTATDDNPTTYTITRTGLSSVSGSWSSGQAITISVDGRSEGTYTYTCTVTDADGLTDSDSVTVTVTAAPVAPVINSPSNVNYQEGQTGNSISWTATDENPTTYTITRSGLSDVTGSWSSGQAITVSVDGRSVGTYT